jgi:DNA-binding SARP family transcriptional activator
LELRILGPVEVRTSGPAREVRGDRIGALLGRLLLERGKAVSHERLLEDVWAGRSTKNAVETSISRLRTLLGEDERWRVQSRDGSYRLDVEKADVDLFRFERLTEEARDCDDPVARVELLQQARDLWRGPAFGKHGYADWATGEVRRLDDLRATVEEDYADAQLALGRFEEAAARLEALVAEEPARERRWTLLMRALYGGGRPADALAAYERLCEHLAADSLDAAPPKEALELLRAIKRRDERLGTSDRVLATTATGPTPAASATRAQLPRPSATRTGSAARRGDRRRGVWDRRLGSPGFVGRQPELAQLQRAFDDAMIRAGRLVVITGDAGMGKTRLLEELAVRSRFSGALALWGRGHGAEGVPPYWPWVQVLRAGLGSGGGDSTAPLALPPGVARLLPEAAVQEGAPSSDLDPTAARFRLFDDVVSFLVQRSADRGAVVLIDDAQWADEPSLLLLQFLVQSLGVAKVLIAVAYRESELSDVDARAEVLDGLARLPMTTSIRLRGLSRDEVGELFTSAGVAPASEAEVAAVHRRTGGNPFFVAETLRLAAQDEVAPGGIELRAIPSGVRSVIRRRLQGIAADTREVLSLASISGEEFGLDPLVDDLGDEERVLRAVDEAIGARVVDEIGTGPHRFRFTHALVRDVIYDAVPLVERRRLHRAVADRLASHPGHASGSDASIAHHLLRSGGQLDRARAANHSRAAGDSSLAALAYEDAVAHYLLALEAIDSLPNPEPAARCAVVLSLGVAETRSGSRGVSRRWFSEAIALARQLDDAEAFARAALGYAGGDLLPFWADTGEVDATLVALLTEALDRLPDDETPLRVRLLACLQTQLYFAQGAEPSVLHDDPLAIARRIGDAEALAAALGYRHASSWRPDNLEERLTIAHETRRLAEAINSPELAAHSHQLLVADLLELADVRGSRQRLRQLERAAGDLHLPVFVWTSTLYKAMHTLLRGDLEEGERLAGVAFEIGRQSLGNEPDLVYGAQMLTAQRLRGDLSKVRPVLEAKVAQYPAIPGWQGLLALADSDVGDQARARSTLEQFIHGGHLRLREDVLWLATASVLAELAVRTEACSAAAACYRALLPYRHRLVSVGSGIACWGAVSEYLAMLAPLVPGALGASQHYEHALETYRAIEAPAFAARAQRAMAGAGDLRSRPARS